MWKSGGTFCAQPMVFLWMPKENVAAYPQNGLPAWTHGASASLRGARWLFSFYSQLLYLVALLLGHYEEGDSEFFAAGAKAPYGVG